MKLRTTIIGFYLTALMFSTAAFAQFEGVIKFNKIKSETTQFTYFVKGNKVRIDEYGHDGSVKGTMLIDLEGKTVTALSEERKIYYDATNKKPGKSGGINTQKTGNKQKMQGYECEEWVATSESEGTKISYWVAGEKFAFFEPMLKTLNRKDRLSRYFLAFGDVANLFTMKGVEMTSAGEVRTTLEVSEIEEKELRGALFEIPKGYVKFER